MGIQCRKRCKSAVTNNSKHSLKVYPNLAKDLVTERKDKLCYAGITYIRILTGFVYFAALIDAFLKK